MPEPEPAPTTTVPEPEPTLDPVEAQIAAWEELRAGVQQGAVWTEPGAARPPVHPETPEPTWDAGTWERGTHPDDRPRRSENVQIWVDWCGDYAGCDWLLAQMTWALDHLAADEICVIERYFTRALEESTNYRDSLPGEYGWHQCASVIDPRQPDGRLLSEQPGITVADRCRAVLPADTDLEYYEGGRRDGRRGGLSCDEWGAWAESRRTSYETCDHSALLAEKNGSSTTSACRSPTRGSGARRLTRRHHMASALDVAGGGSQRILLTFAYVRSKTRYTIRCLS